MFKIISVKTNEILAVSPTERQAKARARKIDEAAGTHAARIERMVVTSTDHKTTRITNHN